MEKIELATPLEYSFSYALTKSDDDSSLWMTLYDHLTNYIRNLYHDRLVVRKQLDNSITLSIRRNLWRK